MEEIGVHHRGFRSFTAAKTTRGSCPQINNPHRPCAGGFQVWQLAPGVSQIHTPKIIRCVGRRSSCQTRIHRHKAGGVSLEVIANDKRREVATLQLSDDWSSSAGGRSETISQSGKLFLKCSICSSLIWLPNRCISTRFGNSAISVGSVVN